jgi:hypothetical protein
MTVMLVLVMLMVYRLCRVHCFGAADALAATTTEFGGDGVGLIVMRVRVRVRVMVVVTVTVLLCYRGVR